ncbi:hypothetical protein MMC07_008955 [Pseudocyphellaria aurata]|nr:hypothetical protein [Pseudocyphellaria aurata]
MRELIQPKTSNGKQKIAEALVHDSETVSSPTTRVANEVKTPDWCWDKSRRMKAPQVVAESKATPKFSYDYLDQVNRLKMIRHENHKNRYAEEITKPKEIAKVAIRAELEMQQQEHVEVEARTIAIVGLQTALMNKIVEDTRDSLREVYAKQIKDEIYAQYNKTAAAHKEEVKSELVKQLTPEIMASLKAQYAAEVKVQVGKQRDEELRSKSISPSPTLNREVQLKLREELTPEVKATLRAELTEPIKQALRKELRVEIYADRENVAIDCEIETNPRLMPELVPTVEATMKKEHQDQMSGEIRADSTEIPTEFELDQNRRLISVFQPSVGDKHCQRLTENLTPLIKAELRDELVDERALKSDLLEELKIHIEEFLTTQYTHKFGRAGGARLTPQHQMQNELWTNLEAALKNDLFAEVLPQVVSIVIEHFSIKLGQAIGTKPAPDAQKTYSDERSCLEIDKSVYDGPTDCDLRYHDNDHYDDQYDNGDHRYQDDDHDDSENHDFQTGDYDDNGEHQHRQQDQDNPNHDGDDRFGSLNRLNRDEQPSYQLSPAYQDEDLSYPSKQSDESDHVDEMQDEASPSSASRGVKRSRIKGGYEEDYNWGRTHKRGRTSFYGGEDDLSSLGDQGGGTDQVDEAQEETPPSSAFRGVKRSGIKQTYDEDGYWGHFSTKALIPGCGGEAEERDSGEEMGETDRDADTRGSSKEDAIDLADSESESEAIALKVAVPVIRRGPFLDDSDDEGNLQDESMPLGILAPRPASTGQDTGQDAQAKSSVGWEELTDYESGGNFDGEIALAAGGEGTKNLEE